MANMEEPKLAVGAGAMGLVAARDSCLWSRIVIFGAARTSIVLDLWDPTSELVVGYLLWFERKSNRRLHGGRSRQP